MRLRHKISFAPGGAKSQAGTVGGSVTPEDAKTQFEALRAGLHDTVEGILTETQLEIVKIHEALRLRMFNQQGPRGPGGQGGPGGQRGPGGQGGPGGPGGNPR